MELLTLIKKWLREIETGVNWTQRIERHLICELGTQTQRPWTREVTCDELYLKRRNCDSRRFKSNIQHRSNELSIFYDHSTIPLTLLYALHNQGTDTHLIIRNHHFFHCTTSGVRRVSWGQHKLRWHNRVIWDRGAQRSKVRYLENKVTLLDSFLSFSTNIFLGITWGDWRYDFQPVPRGLCLSTLCHAYLFDNT